MTGRAEFATRQDEFASNGQNAEVQRLKGELERSRARERTARSEANEAREHFAQLRSMSASFAASMRRGAAERHRSRRRIAAQYAVGQVLADADDVDGAVGKILRVLVRDLGWTLGLYWS